MFGQGAAQGQEFLTRVDGAENLAPDLLRRLHLAGDLVGPFVRNVASGTARAHPRAVGVGDRRLELREHVVLHLVTAHAELLGIAGLERCIEATPEDDTTDESSDGEYSEAQMLAGSAEGVPEPSDESGDAHGSMLLRGLDAD